MRLHLEVQKFIQPGRSLKNHFSALKKTISDILQVAQRIQPAESARPSSEKNLTMSLHVPQEHKIESISASVFPKNHPPFQTTLVMPAVSTIQLNESNQAHRTPCGFCYRMSEEEGKRILHGGKFLAGKWQPAFKIEAPKGVFTSLGNYIYFKDGTNQTIINHHGSLQLLINCLDAVVKNGKLYTIEISQDHPSERILAMQPLDESGVFQARGLRKEYWFKTNNLQLVNVSDNEIVTCLKENQVRLIDFTRLKPIKL